MLSTEKKEYFDTTVDRETRDDLKKAVSLLGDFKVAIDCGCGAGSDIAFLRYAGLSVHGFDVEEESISRCRDRFTGDDKVYLSKASFNDYEYPTASLIVADASLFFCPEEEFSGVWQKINRALVPNGIFCGSFLGTEDTMASPDYDKDAYWPDVLAFNEPQVKECFKGFEVVSFKEHKQSGIAPGGEPHDWHIYSVVARKRPNNAN